MKDIIFVPSTISARPDIYIDNYIALFASQYQVLKLFQHTLIDIMHVV